MILGWMVPTGGAVFVIDDAPEAAPCSAFLEVQKAEPAPEVPVVLPPRAALKKNIAVKAPLPVLRARPIRSRDGRGYR